LAPTTLDQVSARALAPAWFFATGDAVTANPIVVGSTLYVGSWDGHFYALDRVTGQARWKFEIAPQPAVTPGRGSSRATRAPTAVSSRRARGSSPAPGRGRTS
jgi:outer membrane protein assembly factor BamB